MGPHSHKGIMTLDPRAQLAQTMLLGLANQKDSAPPKKVRKTQEWTKLETEQARRAMEALTEALLDPCATVQEAVLDSLLLRSKSKSSPSHEQDHGFRSLNY